MHEINLKFGQIYLSRLTITEARADGSVVPVFPQEARLRVNRAGQALAHSSSNATKAEGVMEDHQKFKSKSCCVLFTAYCTFITFGREAEIVIQPMTLIQKRMVSQSSARR